MLLINQDMEAPRLVRMQCGDAVYYTHAAQSKETNEDCLALVEVSDTRCVLAVADGMGGAPRGHEASRAAVDAIAAHVQQADPRRMRSGILDGFESAHAQIMSMGNGTATTLVVVEMANASVRSYHTGDSGMLLAGRGGRLKLKTVFHSPTGYAEESGLITPEQALLHDERHYVSNMLGAPQMSIEISALEHMARFDTVVLGSDGLFDNCATQEIIDAVRRGDLLVAGERLLALVRSRMDSPRNDSPSKPDDLAFILFRRGSA